MANFLRILFVSYTFFQGNHTSIQPQWIVGLNFKELKATTNQSLAFIRYRDQKFLMHKLPAQYTDLRIPYLNIPCYENVCLPLFSSACISDGLSCLHHPCAIQ